MQYSQSAAVYLDFFIFVLSTCLVVASRSS
jgi:hypothetical protein